jgi:hypothetical protein
MIEKMTRIKIGIRRGELLCYNVWETSKYQFRILSIDPPCHYTTQENSTAHVSSIWHFKVKIQNLIVQIMFSLFPVRGFNKVL